MGLENTKFDGIYANVIADGSIRVVTTIDNPNAVRRDIKLKDGTEMTKYELIYNELSGKITNVSFVDGLYGTTVQIVIDDGKLPVKLNLSLASNFGEDFLKKLPNIKLDEEVTLKPYSFTDDKKKLRKGVSINQGVNKVLNFFYDTEAKQNTNGFPNAEGDKSTFKSDDWKIYFLQCRKFLQTYTEEHFKFVNSEDQLVDVESIPM